MAIRHYPDALNDFNKAIKLNAPTRIFFLRGVVNLLLEVGICKMHMGCKINQREKGATHSRLAY